MELFQRLKDLFSIMNGTNVQPTAWIITICSVIFAAVIVLVIILAKKNKEKKA